MIRLLEGLATVARGQTEIIAALARRPLSERLLLQLLDLADTNEDDGTGVTPRVSQATMAAMVGANRDYKPIVAHSDQLLLNHFARATHQTFKRARNR